MKIRNKSDFSYKIIVILLIIGIVFLSYRFVNNNILGRYEFKQEDQGITSNETTDNSVDFFSEIWISIRQIDFTDPAMIISSQIPYLTTSRTNTDDTGIATFVENKDIESKEDINVKDYSQSVNSRQDLDRSTVNQFVNNDMYNESDGNEGELSDEIKIQINTISDTLPPVSLSGEGPQILIYHTHSLEAYKQDSNYQYDAIAAFRSNDLNDTVVSVGAVLAENLEKKGIPVIHDRTNHEQYSWKDGLYPRSLETINKNIEKYDSLKIFLDIHRDYNESLKDPDKEIIIINGERVAKFFVLIGTGEGVSGGFNEKPNWRENYKFALKITNKANEKYPGLAGDIVVRTGRYNQHISTNAVLIEIGNHLTTLEEAKRTAVYLAEVLSEIIDK